jgi:indolepyruvate ferredoxin oxidoreductase alpha subunit
MKSELLLGDEAIGLAAIHEGIGGAFSYPGTPATEIFEYIHSRAAEGGFSARWSANEKVAYEEALGMSYAGRRAIISMKHVGLNVAADPFVNSALTGVNGGVVCVVADDPGMHSSQNEQDSRYYGEFAKIPVFEPSNQQEAYDLTREAFAVSEQFGLPVLIRVVTRLAHSRANVHIRPPEAKDGNGDGRLPLPDPNNWTLVPSNARRRFRHLLNMQKTLQEWSEKSSRNQLSLGGRRGVITSGLAHNYVREALGGHGDFSVLKICTYPIPVARVRDLVDHCDEITVVEEGYPYIETRLGGLLGLPGKSVHGKLTGKLPPDGELTPDIVANALSQPARSHPAAMDDLTNRPPALCRGCPHADTFKAIVDATARHPEAILFSDIGCYTLGVLPPYKAVHSCVDMGASIAMAHGAAQAGAYPVLSTIGDSTFTHSGMTPLIGAIRSNADMTVFILDNAIVAMTGGQETMAAGQSLLDLLKGLGIKDEQLHVVEPLPKNHKQVVDVITKAIEHRGLSVIVAQRECIHNRRKAQVAPAAAKPAAACTTCGQ